MAGGGCRCTADGCVARALTAGGGVYGDHGCEWCGARCGDAAVFIGFGGGMAVRLRRRGWRATSLVCESNERKGVGGASSHGVAGVRAWILELRVRFQWVIRCRALGVLVRLGACCCVAVEAHPRRVCLVRVSRRGRGTRIAFRLGGLGVGLRGAAANAGARDRMVSMGCYGMCARKERQEAGSRAAWAGGGQRSYCARAMVCVLDGGRCLLRLPLAWWVGFIFGARRRNVLLFGCVLGGLFIRRPRSVLAVWLRRRCRGGAHFH